jgi:hypothetical protein
MITAAALENSGLVENTLDYFFLQCLSAHEAPFDQDEVQLGLLLSLGSVTTIALCARLISLLF